MPNVCILGLGYIGLPTAIITAEKKISVIGFDVDSQKVESINNLNPPIDEPEIKDRLIKVTSSGYFTATTTIIPADYFVIAVPTPFIENKKADLSYVWQAAESIATVLKNNDTIILESTVPVKTTEKLAKFLQKKTSLKAGRDFYVAHCPERVLPGKIFHELVYNARVIGGINDGSTRKAIEFYEQFVKGTLHASNARTAELTKLIENSYRDVNIAFAQEVGYMAEKLGLNPYEVVHIANKHPRVNILQPSCGVGGHCIAIDPWFLVETFGRKITLVKTARKINDDKPLHVIKKIEQTIDSWQKNYNKTPRVLFLGITYKPNIDDIRESAALSIVDHFKKCAPESVLICDPYAPKTYMNDYFGKQKISLQEGVAETDIIVCLVKHDLFKEIKTYSLAEKKILDFCGLLYTPEKSTDSEKFWPAQEILLYQDYDEPKEAPL